MLNLEYCIIVRFLPDISFILTTVWEGMSTVWEGMSTTGKKKQKTPPANSKVGGT